jgi:alpha-galactosidase
MIKVAIIGAGSVVFTKNLTGDILSYPEFRNAHFSYMDIDEERLKVGVGLCRRIAKGIGANPTIEGTLDLAKAIQGADFVITTVQVGGFNSTLVDFDIPRKYGVNFTIADTTGPGGIFRALRTFPFFKNLVEKMEQLCPKATLLNYSNPMSMNMLGIDRSSSIKSVGLCHSVQGTFNQLMRYIDVDPNEANFICAGINHMAFYLKMEHRGEDLYPRLFKTMDEAKIYNTNKVRFELMRHLGYYITESSEHNAEYCSFFIPHGHEVIKKFDIPIDEYLRRCDGIVDSYEKMRETCQLDEALEHNRSHEYGSAIIHSIATNTPRVVYGNMRNNGCISNIPNAAIVEAPTLVDGNGLQFASVGELPPQLLGYVMPHVVQHELYVRAAMEGRRDHVYQACMNDPLTAATLTLDQIVDMCDEMIQSHGDLLPKLDKSPRGIPFSGKTFKTSTAEELRAHWEQRKPDDNDIILRNWNLSHAVPKLISGIEVQTDEIVSKKQFVTPAENVSFSETQSSIQGFLRVKGPAQHYYYAYHELESVHQRETTISLGSSGDTKVWLNGEEVLTYSGNRTFKANENQANINLKEGWNKILVAFKRAEGEDQGFAITIPKADF